jgi:hypothetical protein
MRFGFAFALLLTKASLQISFTRFELVFIAHSCHDHTMYLGIGVGVLNLEILRSELKLVNSTCSTQHLRIFSKKIQNSQQSVSVVMVMARHQS